MNLYIAKSHEKIKETSEKNHEKMDALMKILQIGILARKFESREKFHPKMKAWQTGALGKYHGENLANRRHV